MESDGGIIDSIAGEDGADGADGARESQPMAGVGGKNGADGIAAPRKRGRPRKAKARAGGTAGSDGESVEVPVIGGDGSGSPGDSGGKNTGAGSYTGAKRGRKAKKGSLGLGRQIQGAHKILGLLPGVPEELVEISDQDADALGEAIQDVLVHYDMTVNPVWAAWINLAAVVGVVYGPKIAMVQAMRKQAQPRKPQPPKVETESNSAFAWAPLPGAEYGPMM
jgi:hypothetical protein